MAWSSRIYNEDWLVGSASTIDGNFEPKHFSLSYFPSLFFSTLPLVRRSVNKHTVESRTNHRCVICWFSLPPLLFHRRIQHTYTPHSQADGRHDKRDFQGPSPKSAAHCRFFVHQIICNAVPNWFQCVSISNGHFPSFMLRHSCGPDYVTCIWQNDHPVFHIFPCCCIWNVFCISIDSISKCGNDSGLKWIKFLLCVLWWLSGRHFDRKPQLPDKNIPSHPST